MLYSVVYSLLSTLYSTLYSTLHATFYSLLVGSIGGSLTFVNVHECCSVILESCNTKVTLQSMRCLFPLHWAWTKWHTSKANWLPMASHTGPLWRDSLCDLDGKTLFLRENVFFASVGLKSTKCQIWRNNVEILSPVTLKSFHRQALCRAKAPCLRFTLNWWILPSLTFFMNCVTIMINLPYIAQSFGNSKSTVNWKPCSYTLKLSATRESKCLKSRTRELRSRCTLRWPKETPKT